MPDSAVTLVSDLWTGNGEVPATDHHIGAHTSLVEREYRTLKYGDCFAVLDRYGDCGTARDSPEGLYFRDTRYLSHLLLLIGDQRPLLLSSVIQDDNAALTVDLSNPEIEVGGGAVLPQDLIFFDRTKFLWADACYERIGLRNYDTRERRFVLKLHFDADFRDLFEVRGEKRQRRGERRIEVRSPDCVAFTYTGLDGAVRQTQLCFGTAPNRLDHHSASYDLVLGGCERCSLLLTMSFEESSRSPPPDFLRAYRDKRRTIRQTTREIATVETSNELINEIFCRSTSDLYMLLTQTRHGVYPFAGIPWYSTVFGRDGIITAIELLWVDPSIAHGVLTVLAATQARDFDATADAQPGKILHERRDGEMARLGEVPFRRYYGTVDATPLFVLLAGLYHQRTGDIETIRGLWPNIVAALAWCDEYGDGDGDGFVEYYRQTPNGLANQGWKDSRDSIFHADGSDATGPIALCEVQAYVYAAKLNAVGLAAALGESETAARLTEQAETLRLRFEAAFWSEEIGTYALALDGDKRRCLVRTSNAGHALFAGIAAPDRAARVAANLMNESGFSRWGIRTLGRGEPRYNPMSYHNGSVWPHDNALVALGFAAYDLKADAVRVLQAMFDAAVYQEDRRLPELFCGFSRKRRRGPTGYPVACVPQAWAAASPFALLAACVGLSMRHDRNEVHFRHPQLPASLDDVVLKGLRLGGSSLDLTLRRHAEDVTVNVTRRTGDAVVVLSK